MRSKIFYGYCESKNKMTAYNMALFYATANVESEADISEIKFINTQYEYTWFSYTDEHAVICRVTVWYE